MRMKFVKPIGDVLVRNPDMNFAHVPKEGCSVQFSGYWKQLEREGAITASDIPAKKPAAKPAPKAEGGAK